MTDATGSRAHGHSWSLCDYPADIEAVLGPPSTDPTPYRSVRNLPTDPNAALLLALLSVESTDAR